MNNEFPNFNNLTFKGEDGKKEYHLEIYPEQISSYIFSAGSPGRIKSTEKILEDPVVIEGRRGLAVITGYYKGLYVTGFTTGMGPGSVAITLPEILSALWQRDLHGYIIRIGTSGNLQPYIKPGDFVISTAVVRDESTTSKIIHPEYPSYNDPIIYLSLLKAAYNKNYHLGRNLHIGVTHSKDELYLYEQWKYAPTSKNNYNRFLSYERMGVLATEMEASVYPIYRDYYNYLAQRKGLSSRIYVGTILLVLSGYWRATENIEVDNEIIKNREFDSVQIALEALQTIDKFFKKEETLDDYLRTISTLHGAMI